MASHPNISAIVCTRNRGASAVMAVETILANTYPSFELILIDQSTNCDTEQSVAGFRSDPRFQYVRTTTNGLGRARNIGLRMARAPLVAFTDDDCTVPTDWLQITADILERETRVTVLFCNVLPGEHDADAGFIPYYLRADRKLVQSFWDKCQARGIGAGIAVRRDPILKIGGFDEELGAGGFFPSAEDADIAVRAIAHGQWVYETDEVAVVHYGFRTWREGRELAKRDWLGLGAAYVKPLKAGKWGALIIVLYELLVPCLIEPLSPLLRFRRPRGLGRMVAFVRGLVAGMRQPIDHEQIVYRIERESPVPAKA
ncbi:glycosyltransferase [Chloroflexales bacterium ZM16-3]|nr:glycosyltransferase [Chloroflexales bacterium ZM16-3]